MNMNALFYTKRSTSAIFLWPALAFNIDGGLWVELAWLGFAVGACFANGVKK